MEMVMTDRTGQYYEDHVRPASTMPTQLSGNFMEPPHFAPAEDKVAVWRIS
jgi:hypothetical protein